MVRDTARPSHVRLFRYGGGESVERVIDDVRQVTPPTSPQEVVWVDVVGLKDTQLLEGIASAFGVHGLTLEDIVNTHQRPKTERYESYVYLVVRAPTSGGALTLRQLSLVVGKGFVLSFEEEPTGCLEPIRERVRSSRGRAGTRGADYLAYAILDSTVDHFFPVLDSYADQLERVEQIVLYRRPGDALALLYAIKEDLHECRRSIAPLRNVLGTLARGEEGFFLPETEIYLRDCHDHVVQLLESIESDKDTATGLMELYVSNVGNRMNEVMKVLTVIATIFIPLSFIAGVYGMNFDRTASRWNMPELGWAWGYPAALGLMLATAVGMLTFFWRRGWLTQSASRAER